MSAGAQLADIIPSAFFEATNTTGKGSWNTGFAELLKPCIWKQNGIFEDRGVSLQPRPYYTGDLNDQQKKIFRFYGFSL
jgi:hypothetical protein